MNHLTDKYADLSARRKVRIKEKMMRDWQKEVKAIPLDKVKKAREEIEDKIYNYPDRNISEYEDCLAILDRLIESEDKE